MIYAHKEFGNYFLIYINLDTILMANFYDFFYSEKSKRKISDLKLPK